MFGNRCDLHESFIGEIGHAGEAGNVRNTGTPAGIDEDFFAFE